MKYSTIKILTICGLLLFTILPNTLFATEGGGSSGGPEALCQDAKPFCSDESYNFENETNTSVPDGPNYGVCADVTSGNGLSNPVWYYMQIEDPGTLQLHLHQTTGSNETGSDLDLDFVMWGPYGDISDACTQIMNGAPPIQRSYSPDGEENIGIGVQGGSNYWCGNDGYGPTTPPPAQTGDVYVVMITNPSGSSGYVSFAQTGGTGSADCEIVTPCSIVDFTSDASPCDNDLYSVTGSIEFSDPPDTGDLIVEDCNGNQSIVASAPFTSPVNYNLTGLDADGDLCSVKVHFTEDVGCSKTINYTAPVCAGCTPPSLTLNDINVCDGIDADLNNAIDPSSDAATKTFYNSQADANNATNAISNTVSAAGSYWVRAEKVNDPTCFEVYEITVTVDGSTSQGPSFDFDDFCEGAANGPSNIASPGGQFSFKPAVTDGATINSTTGEISNAVGGTTYTIEYETSGACSTTETHDIIVNEIPAPQFEGDELTGCNPLTVNFTNLSNNTSGTCQWDFGDGNTSTLCDNVTHNYQYEGTFDVSLTITDALGCAGTHIEYDYINVTPKPEAQFSADPMITGTGNPEVTFTNGTENGLNFTWTFGDDTPPENTYDATHIFPNDEAGEYIVTLIASNGPECSDTVKTIITVEEELIFYIPNTFTPDDDEYNQVFKPIFTSGFDPQTYSLSIYDRWGEIIFESHNTDVGWDGSYGENSSKVIKQGIYIWEIKVKETGRDKRNTYTGHVSLLK